MLAPCLFYHLYRAIAQNSCSGITIKLHVGTRHLLPCHCRIWYRQIWGRIGEVAEVEVEAVEGAGVAEEVVVVEAEDLATTPAAVKATERLLVLVMPLGKEKLAKRW